MNKADTDAAITAVAYERVTWEGARNITLEKAQAAFVRKDEKLALALRDLADIFEQHRLDASKKQDELLNLARGHARV